MIGEGGVEKGSEWKGFIGRHWKITALFVVAGILVLIGAIYVFSSFAGSAQSSGLVPSTLSQWTMAHVVSFVLNLVFWELILVGIPAAIGAIAGRQWWRRLPAEERTAYHFSGKRRRTASGGSGGSTLLFVVFAIKVYIDGNWNVAISTWRLDYVVNSLIAILIWVAVIFGIPAAIGLIWWIRREMKKTP